jgi:hypothetical protein
MGITNVELDRRVSELERKINRTILTDIIIYIKNIFKDSTSVLDD